MKPLPFSIHLITVAATVAAALPASAQSFNIDIGATPSTNPTVGYGAGADQPGFWSWVQAIPGSTQGLNTLTGGASPVTITIGLGGGGNFAANNVLTGGDDEALMDDVQNLGAPGASTTYSFNGLAPGGYWIYTYAWAPDNDAYRTIVHVAGSPDPDQTVGGPWVPALGQTYLRTFSKHFVVYAGGPPLQVTATTAAIAGTFGSVNGFQLFFGGVTCDGRFDSYCTAKTNSAGCLPVIGHAGPNPPSAGVFVNGFNVTATNILNAKPGLLIISHTGPQAVPLGGGTLCILGPIKRGPGLFSGGVPPGACNGNFSMDFNAYIASGVDPALQVPGQGVWVQYWSRDPGFAAPNNMNLTDALNFTICF